MSQFDLKKSSLKNKYNLIKKLLYFISIYIRYFFFEIISIYFELFSYFFRGLLLLLFFWSSSLVARAHTI